MLCICFELGPNKEQRARSRARSLVTCVTETGTPDVKPDPGSSEVLDIQEQKTPLFPQTNWYFYRYQQ